MRKRSFVAFLLIGLSVFSLTVLAERTKLKPGLNNYSPQQDIEMGREVAKEAEKELVVINDSTTRSYITALGQRLATKIPNEYNFPFSFKVVDDRSINAFALPGGPIYIHRGAIEAADNEAQLAGVIGHEMGHVILRHGTNQASKAELGGGLLGVLGAVLGGTAGQITQIGGGFLANSVLLKYSRDAETQADLIGTQVLYDLNYDPKGMADFFDKLAKEHKGSKAEEFFSNHPIPENRIAKVNEEIRKIGPPLASPRSDSAEFQAVKKIMLGMPDSKKPAAQPAAGNSNSRPPAPSTRTTQFQNSLVRLKHPDNWKAQTQDLHVTIAPDGGAVQGNLAYGVIVDVFKPQNARNLEQATSQLVDDLRKGNPSMQIVRSRVQTSVDGRRAFLTETSNDSPAGGRETDMIITTERSNGEVLYFVLVAPSKEISQYQKAFSSLMDSVDIR